MTHKQSLLARIRLDTLLATRTYEGVVLPDASGKRPTMYASVFVGSPSHSVERFQGDSTQRDHMDSVVSVGATPEQAQAVSERVIAQLLDHRLIVAGRSYRRLRHPIGRPVEMDDTVLPPIWTITDVFDSTSSPS